MGKLSRDNLRKTVYYLKKNGWKNTILAAVERLQKKAYDDYTYEALPQAVLEEQRKRAWKEKKVFSIVVPLYHTPEVYFKELVESVLNQTYPYFELVLADASADRYLESVAAAYGDERIRYRKLSDNAGISENTNQGILAAEGDFIALLDHDDLLTPDALYEMADVLATAGDYGIDPVLLYSDEDKCSGDGNVFYEPHFKQDFDPELLMTNNYICHFTAVRADVMKRLLLRKEYDGAQDFDLVLRVTADVPKEAVIHIPKVLYHWRCHTGSTAANPESKRYAYESGKRAVQYQIDKKGWKAEAKHLKHLGFYRVHYLDDIFKVRPEVGAVGGRVLNKRNILVGGMMDDAGKVAFEGLRDGFSGYVNRAALTQQASALDLRCMRVRPECADMVQEIIGVKECIGADGKILEDRLPQGADLVGISLRISSALRNDGYMLLWDPQISVRL